MEDCSKKFLKLIQVVGKHTDELQGAFNPPLSANVAYSWGPFGFSGNLCMLGLADWPRHSRNKNEVNWTSYEYITNF